jgi:predicted HicB family RNase H-like nuclease
MNTNDEINIQEFFKGKDSRFNMRLPVALKNKAMELADKRGISLTDFIRDFIAESVLNEMKTGK